MIEKIRYYYFIGLYKEKHIKRFMEIGVISESEYKEMIDSHE